jgi:hypothetical protein
MDPIEKLTAIEQIKQLKARYFRLVDSKQYEELEQLFIPDVSVDHSEDHPNAVFNNRREWVAMIRAGMSSSVSIHHGHTPEIEITSSTTARAIWAMQDWIWWPEGVNLPAGVRYHTGWGHYYETYTKSAVGWRIASVQLKRIRVERA